MTVKCGLVEDKSTGRAKGQRKRQKAEGASEEERDFKKYKEEWMGKRRYWRIRESESRLTSQNPHE